MSKKAKLIFIIAIIFFATISILFIFNADHIFSIIDDHEASCPQNLKLQQSRSRELQKLVAEDQQERHQINALNMEKAKKMFKKIEKKDLIRRKRVGEIFGEGCISSAKDYHAAALIYQHGNVPDHYYQTYIWAKKAMEVDKEFKNGNLMVIAIDRYLINIGKKQLFGSQYKFIKNEDVKNESAFGEQCFCMQPIESSFPDELRVKYTGETLEESAKITEDFFDKTNSCPRRVICDTSLKPTPKGSVPGLW